MKFQNLFLINTLILLSIIVSCSNDDSDIPVQEPEENTPVVVNPDTPDPEFTIKTGERKITSQNIEREYILRIPKSYKKDTKTPVVFALHGYTGTPLAIESQTRFTVIGEKENFISVYPAGLRDTKGNRNWILGRPNATNTINDEVFIDDILTFLKSELSIDENRIYVTGFSNGGFMSYQLGLLRSNTFAAIAPNGGYSLKSTDILKPERALPIIHVHGLKDNIIPYTGEVNPNSPYLYVEPSVNLWVSLNEANTEPNIIQDDSSVLIKEWKSGPNNNADVQLVQFKNGTHQWFNKNNTGGIDSSQLIWEFFEAHPKQ